ncbi:MAG TPA: response regulator [Thermoanaerobaculia bacterium]|jgi:CheY-like chemotaxis protein
MTAETRRSIFRYGIAIDLVILATGIGLVWPDAPVLLAVAFTAAVLLAVWKGGWKAGATSLLLSIAALAYFFPESFPPARLVGFTALAAGLGALVLPTHGRRAVHAAAMPIPVSPVPEPELAPQPNVVAFDREFAERPLVRGDEPPPVAEPRKPTKAERRAERERLAREQRERERDEAERRKRLAQEREEAERTTREAQEREEAERAAREAHEREEAERVAREAHEREEAERVEREAQEREEAERVAREAQEREEAERVAREAREREEAERVAREAREREEAERVAREEAERVAREARERELAEQRQREEDTRRAAAEALRLAEEERRAAEERAAREREESARIEREAREQAEAARRAAEEELARATEARERAESERQRIERETTERLEAEKRAAEERLATEREAIRVELEKKLAAEREALEKTASQPQPHAQPKPQPAAPQTGLIDTLTGWFKRPAAKSVNLNTKKIPTNGMKPAMSPPAASSTATRRPLAPRDRRPRLLLLERRRATADTVSPKLKHKGVDIAVVERWVDAVDELFRFRPDAILIDTDHPDFDKAYRTITEQNPKLPVILTGRSAAGFTALPHVRFATFAVRPYNEEELSRLAQQAMQHPEKLLQQQALSRAPQPAPKQASPSQPAPKPASTPNLTLAPNPPAAPASHAPSRPVGVPNPPQAAAKVAAPMVVAVKPPTDDSYEVMCVGCRTPFDALDADWCSCLTKERTLVCTNCLACFCKAAPAYKEKFWVEAPPRLFERKTGEARRQQSGLRANPPVEEVPRPLVLCVEDDEEIQAVVQRVCSNLGYGFIYATNGQDGLNLARLYRPNLILSDAFMPKLDGREMCRLLKEEPAGADCAMIIMTGLYTDTKYRSEAVKRFHVDDYVAKPVAITDLINLLQKHLEGVAGLPAPDDLYEQHRRDVDEPDETVTHDDEESGIALADLLTSDMEAEEIEVPATPAPKPAARPKNDSYAVACVNCSHSFDATRAEWCSCVGRDQTLACTECGGCFCKAPASYKERFWMDAPPSLFERKMIGSKRNLGARSNPAPVEVKRPLILLVEDDENVQLIVKTVVTSMGYGFIAGANGQEGLSLAREYNPELILSDAFMPKLDGREMCRLLKEDPATAGSKAIIMTGLYTDRKYRNEALDYFKVDDYVAKPLAVDDLIKLFKKHLPQEVQAAS